MPALPTIAVYISGHGFGHCVRAATVLSRLLDRCRASFCVVTTAPSRLWPERLRNATIIWRAEAVDAVVIERENLTLDHEATARVAGAAAHDHARLVQREAEWLRGRIDLVVGDVPPVAFDAAALAGVPSIALANFSWDGIYEALGLEYAACVAEAAYRKADLLIEFTPATAMPAFGRRLRAGLVVREPILGRDETRRRLGFSALQRVVLVGLRSLGPGVLRLPPPMPDVRYLVEAFTEGGREDVMGVPSGVAFIDQVAAADVVVAKPGYGILGDAAGAGTRLLYMGDTDFPEHVMLRRWLTVRPWARPIGSAALASGTWFENLIELLSVPEPEPWTSRAAEVAADRLAEVLS